MKNKTRKEFTRQFFRGNKLSFALVMVHGILMSLCNLVLAWLMQQLMDVASGLDTGLTLWQILLIGLGLLLILGVSFALYHWADPRFFAKAMGQYKNYVFERISQKSISAFSGENTSVYISALSNDAATIQSDYLASFPNLITYALMFCGAFALMLLYSPILTLTAVVLSLLPLIVSLTIGNRTAKLQEEVSNRDSSFMSTLKDSLVGFSVVKSFRAEAAMCRLFAESVNKAETAKGSLRKIKIAIECLSVMAGSITQMGVFFVGAWMALTGKGVTAGVVIAFVQLMNYVITPIGEVPKILAGRKAANALIDKLADALSQNVREEGEAVSPALKDSITLKDISFSYEEGKPVLRDVDFTFEAEKSYALVGSSGSGKSTILNLLMASRSDYSGQILYDGKELRDISSESLYEMVSVIQQNVFIFNASIRDNITMFSQFPKEEVDRAIEMSGLSALIAQRGEDYLCGENGSGLSGGEKQRISIARSLLRRSSVLFVDEATAALDAQTAYQVSGAILDLRGMTRIVVTHALDEALLSRYDGILTLKNGEITESGSFRELMEKKGYFYSLYTVSQ